VADTARTAAEVDAVACRLGEAGGYAVSHILDVCDPRSVEEAHAWAPEALGGPVNVLVNNAGVYLPNRFFDYGIEQWSTSFDVNVIGAVRMCQAFVPAMLASDFGRVINIASTAGKYGSANQSAYNASKHALVGLTKCLALETASFAVRVNAVCPGFVDTEFLIGSSLQQILGTDEEGVRNMVEQRTPIGRPIMAREVAALTVYLAARESDGMTGAALTLAGGLILV
jgi:NAD(P)-dependent dehydrogenase (short-subunit alcohol dehydrogenase family)